MSTSLICSFCGKAESDLVRIVPGPTVYICNECVGIASEHLRATEIKVRPAFNAALASPVARVEAWIADHTFALSVGRSDTVRAYLEDAPGLLQAMLEHTKRLEALFQAAQEWKSAADAMDLGDDTTVNAAADADLKLRDAVQLTMESMR